MKKRLATLAILGAMTVSAVAPMSVFAANPEQHKTDVMYVTGAVTPGGGDAGYYVTVPADIVFTDTVKTGAQKLELKSTDPDRALSDDLLVSVTVSSEKLGYLESDGTATSEKLEYNVNYGGSPTETILNKDNHTDVLAGTLSKSAPAINGTATLTSEVKNVPVGTEFKDVLTYEIEQTSPTI
ncbi:hypothetical protein EUBC25_14260 [Claveliimonas bilis]|uniref:hypothetical protein n=1 Tax=Claveliimonas bilis TaxID=3028070 RepID=UPI001E5AA77D|nr:hypothetical protein [Claveliimonas bilis]BCZ27339.1 hypothetical protein EUBC25_14260 [Claveliimonas bilis]